MAHFDLAQGVESGEILYRYSGHVWEFSVLLAFEYDGRRSGDQVSPYVDLRRTFLTKSLSLVTEFY